MKFNVGDLFVTHYMPKFGMPNKSYLVINIESDRLGQWVFLEDCDARKDRFPKELIEFKIKKCHWKHYPAKK